jgi:hypothetical protein
MTFPQSTLPIPDGDENTEQRCFLISLDLIKLTHRGSFPQARSDWPWGPPSILDCGHWRYFLGLEQPEPETDHTYICTRGQGNSPPIYLTATLPLRAFSLPKFYCHFLCSWGFYWCATCLVFHDWFSFFFWPEYTVDFKSEWRFSFTPQNHHCS